MQRWLFYVLVIDFDLQSTFGKHVSLHARLRRLAR